MRIGPQWSPASGGVALAGEAHIGAVAEARQPGRRAGIAIRRHLAQMRLGKGRRTRARLMGIADHLEKLGRLFRGQRAEAETVEIEFRAAFPGQARPVAVDGAEERARRLRAIIHGSASSESQLAR